MRRNNFCWCTFLRERSPQSKLRGTDFHFLSFAYSDLIVGSWHVWEGSTKGSLGRELEATGCPGLPGSHHPLKEQGLMVTHLGKVEVPAARLGPGEFPHTDEGRETGENGHGRFLEKLLSSSTLWFTPPGCTGPPRSYDSTVPQSAAAREDLKSGWLGVWSDKASE